MKKALILSLMISLIVLALVSCGGNEGNGGEQTHTHSFGEWETVEPATCVDKGEKVRYCDCGEMQTGVISSTGEHTEVIDAAVAPTCTEAGLTEGKHCAFCNLIIIAQTPVDATGHTEVVDVAVPATCTKTGLTEGKHCSVCKEVLVKQGVEPIVAHTYDDKYDESCNICGGTRDAECAHTTTEPIPGYAATCTEPGLTDGQKCKKCGEILTHQTTINAKGHTEVTDNAVAPTCTKEGITEGKHCVVCNEIIIAQNVVTKLEHTLDAVGVCAMCDQPIIPTEGIAYKKSEDGTYAMVVGYDGTASKIRIADTYEGLPVTHINEDAFSNEVITSVVIPDSVTFIGDYAFYDCSRLTSVVIPDSVNTIGNDAFSWCSGLTSVVIGDSVITIGNSAFDHCSRLTSVVISDSVNTIGYAAFYGCSNLKDVYYTGREEEWGEIAIGAENSNLTNATKHYNYVPEE